MTLGELINELKAIIEVHEEALDATVWGDSAESGHRFQIKGIAYDNKHKPKRIKFSD